MAVQTNFFLFLYVSELLPEKYRKSNYYSCNITQNLNITLEKKQEVDKNETKVTTKIVC